MNMFELPFTDPWVEVLVEAERDVEARLSRVETGTLRHPALFFCKTNDRTVPDAQKVLGGKRHYHDDE